MKKILCGNPDCDQRRVHFEHQDVMRPVQEVEVADDYRGKAFCSITCACVAGYYNVRTGWVKDPSKE
jgi:hypothetical protein